MMIIIKVLSQRGVFSLIVARTEIPGILNVLEESKPVREFNVFSIDSEIRLSQDQLGFGDFTKWRV